LLPVSLAVAVENALNLVGTQLREHNIRVLTEIPEDLPPVSANAVQLEQMVINLLVNAMHALDTVDAAAGPEKTIRILAGMAESDMVVFMVRDNDPGVGELQSRIFDPFFTTKEPQKGMGLGLSIVHAFIFGWGGSIKVTNNTGGPGATFSVKLPMHNKRVGA
jgi:C4-dicarboxylate-specific signal transduction histidine kinase